MDITCISPDAARHYLRVIEPRWRGFWFHMHLPAFSLEEFVAGLVQIDEDVYDYHVRQHDQRLAAWVQEVVGDAVFAEALRAAPDRAASVAVAQERLKELQAAAAYPLDSSENS